MVKELALLPNKAQYSVTLQVDQEIMSNYGKRLPFKPEMDGQKLLQKILVFCSV